MRRTFLASLEQGKRVTTALRQFKDADGQVWEVWDVVPSNSERRFQRPPTPPMGVERRRKPEFRVNLGMQMANGWLIFASGSLRRRLAPIPEKWHHGTDDDLRAQLASAVPVDRVTSPLRQDRVDDDPGKKIV